MKLDAPTTIDSTTAVVPLTVSDTPFAVTIASVARVTSLNAAKASAGRSNAAIELESRNFLIGVRS